MNRVAVVHFVLCLIAFYDEFAIKNFEAKNQNVGVTLQFIYFMFIIITLQLLIELLSWLNLYRNEK